jgi:transcriptional regulator with XRE-family HTH domain
MHSSGSSTCKKSVKKILELKQLKQKEVAAAAGLLPSNYSKIEKGERHISIEVLDKIARLFGMTTDQVIHYEGKLPKEVTIQDKTFSEKLKLIEQLNEEDKQALFRIIDAMLTKPSSKISSQKIRLLCQNIETRSSRASMFKYFQIQLMILNHILINFPPIQIVCDS